MDFHWSVKLGVGILMGGIMGIIIIAAIEYIFRKIASLKMTNLIKDAKEALPVVRMIEQVRSLCPEHPTQEDIFALVHEVADKMDEPIEHIYVELWSYLKARILTHESQIREVRK